MQDTRGRYSASRPLRIDALDSLRGIAALIVMASHYLQAIPDGASPTIVAAAIKFAAMSVIFFFVLSGYVLAVSYAGSQATYVEFFVRRVFRIYIPVLFSILISLVLQSAFLGWETYGAGFLYEFWGLSHDRISLVDHLFLTGVGEDSIRLNTVIWSAIYEIRLSIFVPIMALVVARFGGYSVAFSIIAGVGLIKTSYLLGGRSAIFAENSIGALLLTLGYAQFFMWGAWLSLKEKALWSIVSFRGERTAWLILICLFVLSSFLGKSTLTIASYAIPSIFLIAVAINCNSFSLALQHRALLWLGKVSFSLYLLHMPILLSFGYLGRWLGLSWGWSFVASACLTIGLSEIFYRYIELRAIAWGRIAANCVRRKFRISQGSSGP